MLIKEDVVKYVLHKHKAIEDYPFGPEPMVAKICGKMFALVSDNQISLKCDPNVAQMLRSAYKAVIPGYHLNKEHWNTVIYDGDVQIENLMEMVDMSYDLVIKGLPKKIREGIRYAV